MSAQDLPTIYELSTIAAILHRKNEGNFNDVARDAISLWFAVAEELRTQQATAARQKAEEWIELGHDGRSPAMAWVNENVDKKRDQFKTFGPFARAFAKYDPAAEEREKLIRERKEKRIRAGAALESVPVSYLRGFIESRARKRRKDDTKNKQKQRSKSGKDGVVK